MKAIVWTAYGPPEVLQVQEVPAPVPKHNEVRIRIRATTVTAGDCEMRRLKLPLFLGLPMRLYAGIVKPVRMTILGQELAGEVDSIGQQVTEFQPGDPVFAATGFGLGGYAEFICLPVGQNDSVVAAKPPSMTFEQAAAVPFGAMEALHFLRKAEVQPGELVLINGAGGSIGTFGVQLAKHYAAVVTAVDRGPKLDMLRSIGADHVVDYTREDFTKSGQTYDVIFDVIGKSPYTGSIRSLKPNGRYLLANPRLRHLIRGTWTSRTTGKRVIAGAAVRTRRDLEFLGELVEAGKLRTLIDRTYPLEQMAEAHRYVETGQKQGNLIITV